MATIAINPADLAKVMRPITLPPDVRTQRDVRVCDLCAHRVSAQSREAANHGMFEHFIAVHRGEAR